MCSCGSKGDDTATSSPIEGDSESHEDTQEDGDQRQYDRNLPEQDWNESALWVVLAPHGDPFHQGPEWNLTIQKQEYQSILARGRLAYIARQVFEHQHRTHLFQLLIFDDEARFIRWDRAGASVSGKFKYTNKPKGLKTFLYTYGCASEAERGWDSSVSPALLREERLFFNACRTWSRSLRSTNPVRMAWKHVLATDTKVALDPGWPTYKVTLGSPSKDLLKDELIIKRPFYIQPDRFLSRGVRRYLAYSTRLKKLVVFKDGWRYDDETLFSEATAYHHLRLHHVSFIPHIHLGGDVIGNVTRTNMLKARRDIRGGDMISKYTMRQHRVVQDLACPLSCLPSTKAVVYVIRDCFDGM